MTHRSFPPVVSKGWRRSLSFGLATTLISVLPLAGRVSSAATVREIPGPSADLSVELEGPVSATSQQALEYTVTVRNMGRDAGTGILLTGSLAPGLGFEDMAPGPGLSEQVACAFDEEIRCSGFALAPGGIARFTLRLMAVDGGESELVTLSVTANEFDPDASNNLATHSMNVQGR